MITPIATAVIFIFFMERYYGRRARLISDLLRVVVRRYEMTEMQHETTDTASPISRLTRGEIIAIVAFWAFLAVLTAAGLLVDPRVAAVAAMRAALRPEMVPGIDKIALVEYGLWALLTLPIFWMTRRYGGDRPTLDRILAFVLLGVVLAIAVDALLKLVAGVVLTPPAASSPSAPSAALPASRFPLPAPSLPPQPVRRLFSRFSFLFDFLVYLAVLGAGLARNYFVR